MDDALTILDYLPIRGLEPRLVFPYAVFPARFPNP